MGHTKRKRPRRGSKQYWPRKRAPRIYPTVRSWADIKEAKLLGFAGYKAGMSSIIVVDNRARSPTKGEEIKVPVTVLEAPAIKIVAVRLYSLTPYGLKAIGEVWAEKLDKDLERKIIMPKKRKLTIEKLKEKLPNAVEVRVIISTQPRSTALGKKTPELLEIPIGGAVEEQFNYANSNLGKDITVTDVLKAADMLDVHAVTKGKGIQGPIKRFGLRLQAHKSEKGRRKVATLGPITPRVVGWWIAHAGQTGYHVRTECNKQLIKIGEPKEQITPAGGFVKYGIVETPYLLIAGSVPGPKKRLVILSHAIKKATGIFVQPPEIVEVSTRSQQK